MRLHALTKDHPVQVFAWIGWSSHAGVVLTKNTALA